MLNFILLYLLYLFLLSLVFYFYQYYIFVFLLILVNFLLVIYLLFLLGFFYIGFSPLIFRMFNNIYYFLIRFNRLHTVFIFIEFILVYFKNMFYKLYCLHLFRLDYINSGLITLIMNFLGCFNNIIVYSVLIKFVYFYFNMFSFLFIYKIVYNFYIKSFILSFSIKFLFYFLYTVVVIFIFISFSLFILLYIYYIIKILFCIYYIFLKILYIFNFYYNLYNPKLKDIFTKIRSDEDVIRVRKEWYDSKAFSEYLEDCNFKLWYFIHKDLPENNTPAPVWVVVLSFIFVISLFIFLSYYNVILPYLFPEDFGYMKGLSQEEIEREYVS